jgi:hypothetical protein
VSEQAAAIISSATAQPATRCLDSAAWFLATLFSLRTAVVFVIEGLLFNILKPDRIPAAVLYSLRMKFSLRCFDFDSSAVRPEWVDRTPCTGERCGEGCQSRVTAGFARALFCR